jgi:hypothetical protein
MHSLQMCGSTSYSLYLLYLLRHLGAFEIMLPNSWANKVDSQADRGGIIGILWHWHWRLYLFVYGTNRRNSFSRSGI